MCSLDGTQRSEPFWRLAFELRYDLPLIAYDSSGVALPYWNQDQVYVEGEAIVFDGGYLEVHDPGLSRSVVRPRAKARAEAANDAEHDPLRSL